MPILLLFGLAAGLYWYEAIYKPAHNVPQPPSTPPSPTSPTYVAGGLTFLNPTLSAVVLQAMQMIPGTSAQHTDPAGNTYFTTEASTNLGDTPMGKSLSDAIAQGAIVLLVGPWASWASAGASGSPPTQPQVMITGLPSVVDVKTQALRLMVLSGGGFVLGPSAQALGIA